MKTVFNQTREVCAVWAAQEQPSARTGSNTSFREQTLYSYGTAIALIIRCPTGGDVVNMTALVSSIGYSSGTSKVQGEAADEAKKAGLTVFRVPSLGADEMSVVENLAHYDEAIRRAVEAIERAVRWDTAASHRRNALALIGEAAVFAQTFGADWKPSGPNPLTVPGKDHQR